MFITLLIGIGGTALWFWARNNNKVIRWWDWLIGAFGVFLLMLTLQNITTAGFEEVTATIPWFLLLFGLPGLILLAVAFQLIRRRLRRKMDSLSSR
jgi:phosphatidylserine synthase